jgi:hypothetical protein
LPARIDPDQIPHEPGLALIVTDRGEAFVNGTPIPIHPGQDPHAMAVAHAAWQIAQLGRPVRASATGPDGITWPLIIHPDGTAVTTGELSHRPCAGQLPQPSTEATPGAAGVIAAAPPVAVPVHPASVPAWPVVSIVVSEHDRPLVEGVAVPVPAGVDPHAAAVAAAARRAVDLGRPVRATATGPDEITWPLIIYPDGSAHAAGEPTPAGQSRPRRHAWLLRRVPLRAGKVLQSR